ncbi:O-antigen ligase family protein [Candidatus Omnitrophota bacterium]
MLGGIFFVENQEIAVKRYFDLCVPLSLVYFLMKSEFTTENRWIIVRSISIFSGLVALCGILELVFQKNPLYEYPGVFDLYYYAFVGKRAISTQTHPAALGSYLVVCLPFWLLLIKRKIRFDRWLGVSCLIVGMSGLILTFSRGSLFGSIAAFGVYFWQKNRTLFIKYGIVIVGTFIFIFSVVKAPYVFQRFGIQGLAQTNLYEIRIAQVLTSYRMLRDRPFTGVGLEHFKIKYNEYSPFEKHEDGKTPDNVYLLFLAEAGIIGFLGFIFFIVSLLKKGFRRFYSAATGEESKNILIAILAGLVGLLVNMNTYDLLYWVNPLLFFGILAGMVSAYYDV